MNYQLGSKIKKIYIQRRIAIGITDHKIINQLRTFKFFYFSISFSSNLSKLEKNRLTN